MREYVEIGPVPPDEECAQVGDPDYRSKALKECRRYIRLIRKKKGLEPEGAELKIKWFQHDFGSYAEVVCYYDENNKKAIDYAFRCESKGPQKWEKEEEEDVFEAS